MTSPLRKTRDRVARVPHTTIEPLLNGSELHIRSVAPTDAAMEAAFFAHLPEHCRRFCFLGLIRQNGDAASALTSVDPACEVSLIGVVRHAGVDLQVGAARFRCSGDGTRCDCAVAVDPDWQHLGVGSALMRHLIREAQRRGIKRMYAVDAVNCSDRHWLAQHLGFHRRIDPEDPQVLTFELELEPSRPA